jgi:signal transduction histidine kinase
MCGSHGYRRGGRGFPDREQLVERLQRYQEHLDDEQKKVRELLERLVDAPQPEPSI